MKYLLGALLIGALSGCSSLPTSTQTQKPKYQLTLYGTIDGVDFSGTAMGSSAKTHDIVVKSMVSVNYFTAQTCHRANQFNDKVKEPWYSWLSGPEEIGFNWSYSEAPTIEDTGDCPLRICAFSNTPGSPPVACAVMDFHAPKYNLPSVNICNGVSAKNYGSSMCHTMVGLIERIKFDGPVVVAPPIKDPAGKLSPYSIKNQCQGRFVDPGETLWEYYMPSDECTLIFMEKAKPHRRAKLTVIPYDKPLYGGA